MCCYSNVPTQISYLSLYISTIVQVNYKWVTVTIMGEYLTVIAYITVYVDKKSPYSTVITQ